MEDFFKNNSKIALITGSSSGLGKCLAHLLVSKGWFVFGIARRENELERLKEDLGTNFDYMKCDVTDNKDVKKVSDKLKKNNIIPKLMFLNAGIARHEKDGTLDLGIHENTFKTNYFGAINWIHEWLPFFLKNGGIFVGTASIVAKYPIPYSNGYSASKAALASLFESLRTQYLNTKVKFITIYPGPMKTGLLSYNLPFIENPLVSAEYILKKIFSGKETISFPFLYRILFSILPFLPRKLIKKFVEKFEVKKKRIKKN